MAILSFIIHLMSGATLLLFAVRFMRIGIERLWSGQIRRNLSRHGSKPSLIAKGAALGFIMQGATVVMLMAAGMVGSNTISILSATILAMGADLGSAVAVQVLTLPVSAIGPAAVLLGGWFYLNSEEASRRNLGRVVLGLGLIFLSLVLIREAVAPLKDFPGTAAVIGYLNADPVTAALCGILLTFLMHSSLAAILTALAFASHGDLGAVAGVGFVIGCNVGSALLPIWLMRNEEGEGIVVAKSLAVLRVSLAVLLLLVLVLVNAPELLDLVTWSAASMMMAAHLGFNCLLLLFAPLVPWATRQFEKDIEQPHTADRLALVTQTKEPELVLASLRGHVSRMLDALAEQFEAASAPTPDTVTVLETESRINRSLSELREAFAGLPPIPDAETEDLQNIFDFAIRLENCGDILSGRYTNLRKEGAKSEYQFSDAGQDEILEMTEAVRKGLALAQSVFWTENPESARKLVLHKQHVTQLEEQSRANHLQRVRAGNLTSLSSSNEHMEVIAALKAVNSKLATIAYAVLEQSGGLKKTRLKSVSGH